MQITSINDFFQLKKKDDYIIVPSKKDIVLVTSTICYQDIPLSYSCQRSIFSWDERYNHTLKTLIQIRSKIPNCMIILLENSPLPEEYIINLKEISDLLILFSNDKYAIKYRDSKNKGSGELYMLIQALKIIKPIRYDRLFKISGRYYPTEVFNDTNYPNDKYCFLLRDDSYSTRFYSIPKKFESNFERQLRKGLRFTEKGFSIENVIMRGVPKENIYLIPYLGIAGDIAPSGFYISE